MHRFTALILTVLGAFPISSFAQDSIQDWSKKVIDLQEKQGQNFEQDLQLVKGFLYLQRRADALILLNTLLKSPNKKDARIGGLFETASDQFFFQETAELYADVVQLIKEESWTEAKDKVEVGLQKEKRHRLLTLRSIQLGAVMGQSASLAEVIKFAENNYPERSEWKVYTAWISLAKNEFKDAYRIISNLFGADKKLFENSEAAALVLFQSTELIVHNVDWIFFNKVIQNHPEWVGLRLWKLKNKVLTPEDRSKEIAKLRTSFADMVKLKALRQKQEKYFTYFYSGLISPEKCMLQLEEFSAKTQ